ncbi:hypothetical protein FHR88_006632 [Bradyrhizobium betae]|uniref:Uncharacterized protein n=1 Tax=Bradyrhizobium betae TaxID=244734 RepID=A0A5P6P753_9BRAD|nr:hypothetical protein [Bradyrhizobium betae]MCS3731546.1 hypothetical protein [Bradyrhizobium betae]QFI74065.1 hypothetical protein F8237_17635 [Bradyrhizobium betae]
MRWHLIVQRTEGAAHGNFYRTNDATSIEPSTRAATAFLLELIARLQAEATVPMIDIRTYAKFLKG